MGAQGRKDKMTGTGEAIKEPGLAEAKDLFRKHHIHRALLKNSGIVTKTAKELGISRQYLSRLMSRYDIKPV